MTMYFKVEIDGKKYIPVEDTLCATRIYEFSKEYVGPRSVWQEQPIDVCNKNIGWTADDYLKVQEYWESVRRELNKPRSRNKE